MEKESEMEGCCSSRAEKKEVIRRTLPQQYWQEIQSPLLTLSQKIETEVQNNIDRLINNFCDRYKRQFDKELQNRQEYMESLEGYKRTNEELRDEISDLEAEKKTFEDNINKCTQIAGEL